LQRKQRLRSKRQQQSYSNECLQLLQAVLLAVQFVGDVGRPADRVARDPVAVRLFRRAAPIVEEIIGVQDVAVVGVIQQAMDAVGSAFRDVGLDSARLTTPFRAVAVLYQRRLIDFRRTDAERGCAGSRDVEE